MGERIDVVSPDKVTPEWIQRALAANDIAARIDAVSMSKVGTGQLGETCRFEMTYRGSPSARAPRSLVGKFTAIDEVSYQTGRDFGIYRTEVMFYRELASHARIRTPRVYVAEINDDDRFVLLLEDMAPGQQGDVMQGCTLEVARKAVHEAVLLHAAFWNDVTLLERAWVQQPAGAQGFYTTELIERAWHHVQQTYPGALTREVRGICERFVRNHAWWNRPRGEPKCLSHNDFRLDNMLIGHPDGRIAVVDWQTASFLGTGMDIAYFLGGAFTRAGRRRHGPSLLREYHAGLEAQGVRGYGFDHLLSDYAHYSLAAVPVAMAATLIAKRTERGDRMLMQMVTSAAEQSVDAGALDLLPP